MEALASLPHDAEARALTAARAFPYDARACRDDPFMRIIEQNADSVVIELTRGDLTIVSNAINEVCHGPGAIEEWEFATRVGASREQAEALLSGLNRLS